MEKEVEGLEGEGGAEGEEEADMTQERTSEVQVA